MYKLKDLNLNSNCLTSFKDVIIDFTPNIEKLDVGQNNLSFKIESDFQEFIEKLKDLNQLTQLDVLGNTFFQKENLKKFKGLDIKEEIIEQLKNLQVFNGADIETVKININKQREEDKIKKKNVKVKPPPKLEDLLYHLESANSHPSFALDHLKDLAQDVDALIQKIDLIQKYFAPDKDDIEVRENLETFMQNTLILMDIHQEHQETILSMLAKLTIVKFQDFGLMCFNTLKDLMDSGKTMEKQVTEVLKKQVIKQMKQQDPLSIPASLFMGLNDIILSTGNNSLVEGLYDSCFSKWLKKFCELLRESFKNTGMLMGDHEHYDSILSLFAVSIKDDDEQKQNIINQNLTAYISEIFQQSLWEHDRYIPCLRLIATLSNYGTGEEDPDASDGDVINPADQFMESLVHQNLLIQIKKSMVVYKKNNSLFDEHSKETIEQQQLRYQTLASEIETLGGLLQASAENRLIILEEPVVKDLISIMSHKKTDPILLKSICTFALDLFETPELKDDQDRMEPFHKEMADLKMMVPYLGMARYPDLLAMTSRYHSSQNKGYETPGQQDNAQQQEEGAENMGNNVTSLKHLDDPIVNELFISIINLMRFFCLEAEQNEKNKLFDAISYSLNKNRREEGLFNCLGVPDDDVRLAVVKCLYVVPLDELERDEIDQVTAIMNNCSNIAAGKTELVLSVIYQICCKFVQIDLDHPDCPPSCRIFQEQFGEKTMNEALAILNRNLQRTVHADDDWDKYALSVSILNFIKSSTQAPLMQRYMNGKDEIFQEILMNEDFHSSDRVKKLPLDLESSYIGVRIECLLNTLQKALNPYCDVSLRLIMRIADILMNRYTCKDYKLEISEQAGIIDKLMEHQEQYYKKKTSQERDYWVDMPQNFFRVLEQHESHRLEDSHYHFTQGHGQETLIEFLTTQFVQNEEYTVYMSDEKINQVFDPHQKQFKDEIDEFNQKLEDKYKKKYMLDENKKFDPYQLRRAMLQKQSGLNEDDCHDCNKGNLGGFDKRILDEVGNYCRDNEKDYIFIADMSGEAYRQFRDSKYETMNFYYEIKQVARKKMDISELRSILVMKFIECIKSGKQLVINLEEREPKWKDYEDPEDCPLKDILFDKKKLMVDFKKICKNDELKQFDPKFNLIIISNVSDHEISDEEIKEILEAIPNFSQFKHVYIESDDHDESPDMKNVLNTHSTESRQTMQYEKIGNDLLSHQSQSQNSEMTIGEKLIKLNEQHAEFLKKSNDAHQKKFKLKQQRCDGFLNNQLRSITVAALLRCLYGSIEYAPTVELRNSAINNIKGPKIFKRITQLCDSTDWDENCNIGAKYLRVMRNVIKLPHCKGVGYSGFLMHYKLIAIVIQKTLKKIIDKMNKDIELNHGDQVANYEISLTFFQIVQSANNFIFSTEDILKLHLENEIKIERLTKGASFELKPEDKAHFKKLLQDVMKENLNEDNPRRKCQYEDAQQTEDITQFKVQLPDLRHKRTIQQKVVEKMVLSLFSQESIFTLVDILFKDMKADYKTIENTKFKTDSDHEDSDHSHHGLNQVKLDDMDQDDEDSEEDSEDETKYGKDIDQYMEIKGVLTIERIKDVVGEIMNSCAKKMKYEILEKIMKGVIFEKKKVRQSFMQEILNAADNSSYRNALEKYIKYNRFSVANYFNNMPRIGDQMYDKEFCDCNLHPSKRNIERIMELCQVDLNNKFLKFNTIILNNVPFLPSGISKFFQDNSFAKRLFVLTTQGIQIMKEPDASIMCKDCPPQSFCPIGPVQDVCIRYEQIEAVISFVQIPQKLVIIYLTDYIDEKGELVKENECKFQLTLNIPTYTKCSKIYTNLLSILQCIKTQKNAQQKTATIQTFGNFSDKMFQVDLRMFIKQINPSIKKQSINFSTLTYAQLLQIDIITEKYKKELLKPVQNTKTKQQQVVRISMNQVDDKMKAYTERSTPSVTDDGAEGGAGSYFGFSKKTETIEKDLVIKDAVLICVIDGKMLLIKEQWHNWESLDEKANYLPEQLNKLITKEKDSNTPGQGLIELISEDNYGYIQQITGDMSSKIETKLFKLMAFVQVEHIRNVYVNRGKDPTIEIVIGLKNKDEIDPGLKDYTIKIKFPGDMERQRFVDQIIEEWNDLEDNEDGGGQDLVQEKKKDGTPRSEVAAEDDQEEEEDIDCTIYD